MSTVQAPVDFTHRDFASTLAALQGEIRTRFPEWTDFSQASFGNLLIELYAFVLDTLDFYLTNQVNECFLPTVRDRKNLIALGELVGFRLKTAAAATVDATLTVVGGPAAQDIPVPVGTILRAPDPVAPVDFQVLAATTIPAGAPTFAVSAEHSRTRTDTFSADGTGGQTFLLTRTPYLDGSAQVTVEGQPFAEVETFLFSTATAKVFQVKVDAEDRALLRFGDGVNGVPPIGDIAVTYRVGGGSAGNVGPGRVSRLEGTLTDVLGNVVAVTVTNAAAAAGGADRETVAQGRVRAPKAFRSLVRTVTVADFEANAQGVAGVGRVRAYTHADEPSIAVNAVQVAVVPTTPVAPTSALKAAVLTEATVTRPSPLTMQVDVVDPIYVDVDVAAKVFFTAGTTDKVAVRVAIVAALTAFLAPLAADGTANPNVGFGSSAGDVEVARSNLVAEIEAVARVRKVDLATFLPAADVALGFRRFPRLGTVTVLDGVTGLPV